MILLALDRHKSYLEQDYPDVKFLLASKVRTKIMISLQDNSLKLENIRYLTQITSSTILHGINQLIEKNLIEKNGEYYFLTSKGTILSLKIIDFLKQLNTINSCHDFWQTHQIKELPHQLLQNIEVFHDAQLIESTKANIGNPFTTYLEMISNSDKFKAILPIFFPRHLDAIKFLLKNDCNVEMIVTPEIYQVLLKQLGKNELKNYIHKGLLRLWKFHSSLEFALMFSKNFIILGLFLLNGEYDPSKLVLTHDQEAMVLGNNIFNHYLQKSEKIDITNL